MNLIDKNVLEKIRTLALVIIAISLGWIVFRIDVVYI